MMMNNDEQLLSYLNNLKEIEKPKVDVPKNIEVENIEIENIKGDVKELSIETSINSDIDKEIIKDNEPETYETINIRSNFVKKAIIHAIQKELKLEEITIFDEVEYSYKDNCLYHCLICWEQSDINNDINQLKKYIFLRFLHCKKYIENNIAIIYSIKSNSLYKYTFKFDKELYEIFRRRMKIS